MSERPNEPQNDKKEKSDQEFNFSFDGDVGDALGQGMDALKSVLGGIVDAVQDAIGPEGMRNLEAAQWLTQVATWLESVATGLREQDTAIARQLVR